MHLRTTAVSITAALILATPALATQPTTPHGKATSPAQLCKSMSHKKTNHGKGKSPYAACVSGAARAKADLAKTPSVKRSPAKICKALNMSKTKSATDSKSPYAACVSGAAKAQAAHS